MTRIVPPIMSFVAARSGTGKTTLMEKVIAILTKKGYRVATIKHVHQAQFDIPGKDSWRHRKAGAVATGLVAADEFLIVGNDGVNEPQSIIPLLPSADLIMIEGFRQLPGTTKIEVVRNELGREVTTPLEDLAAVVTDASDLDLTVPCFPLNDPNPLVKWIINNFLNKETNSPSLELTHFDESGRARMVDVTAKKVTEREALAKGEVLMKTSTLELIREGKLAKGDVLAVAQVAAIMAVKETPRLIPMCHPLNISSVAVDFKLNQAACKVEIEVKVKLSGQTGVEMEALTGVSVAALTIYDMCKAVDREMKIGEIRLVEKSGGRSVHFLRRE